MSKLITGLLSLGLVFGIDAAIAQNVKSDQDKARGQEQQMEQKEKPTGNAGQSGQSGDRERAKTDDGRSAPGGGAAGTESAMRCDKMSGHEKDECMEHANGKSEDEEHEKHEKEQGSSHHEKK
jgi:hypothetical protein